MDTHFTDLLDEAHETFHLGPDLDEWTLAQGSPVTVRCDSYYNTDPDAQTQGPLVIIDGDLGRGSMNYSELTADDAERLGNALLVAAKEARR